MDENRRTNKGFGNNTGLNTNYTNERMGCRRRDTGSRAVLTRLM